MVGISDYLIIILSNTKVLNVVFITHTVPEDQLWEYISLCGLRTHDELHGEHVCYLYYIKTVGDVLYVPERLLLYLTIQPTTSF